MKRRPLPLHIEQAASKMLEEAGGRRQSLLSLLVMRLTSAAVDWF